MSANQERGADCRVEEEILNAEEAELCALMKASAYAPPAELKAQVMRRIRQEKATAARRRSLKRITAAVCAAVILVPALLILVPMLHSGNGAVADANLEASGFYGTPEAAGEALSAAKDLCAAVPNGADAADAEDNVTSALPMYTAPTKDTVCDGVGDAVDLPCEEAPGNSGMGGSGVMAEYESETETEEPAFYEMLREIVGAEAFDEWLAQYDGAPDYAEQAAYEYFGLTE